MMEQDQQQVEKLLQEAKQFYAANQFAEAKSRVAKAIELNTNHDEALHLLGIITYQQKDYTAAKRYIDQAITINNQESGYYANKAIILLSEHDYANALACCEQALAINSDNVQALNTQGKAHFELSEYGKAEQSYQTAIKVNPNYLDPYINLSELYEQQKQMKKAWQCLVAAHNVNSDSFIVKRNIAKWASDHGNLKDAERLYQQLTEQWPESVIAHAEYAGVLNNLHRYDESHQAVKKAVELAPDSAQALNQYGRSLRDRGEIDEALQCFHKALAIQPQFGMAWMNLSQSKKFNAENDAALIEQMQQIVNNEKIQHDEKMRVYYALAKVMDDCENWDEAFENITMANGINDQYNGDKMIASRLQESKSYFTKDRLNQYMQKAINTEVPIFVVGMPRSGTSLVEQIISSHSQMAGAGELADMCCIRYQLAAILGSKTPYPECMDKLTDEVIKRQVELYLDRLKMISQSNAQRIVDKMPSNFMELGIINCLFPHARIIHCKRNPYATCLSCYFKNFKHDSMNFTNSLENLGGYYAGYLQIMDYWKQVLPMKMLEVNYEDLINEPEQMTRKIINFCDMDWEDACLEFNKTKRVVITASSWQVRQSLYTSSVDRWRNYEQYLEPLKRQLGD